MRNKLTSEELFWNETTHYSIKDHDGKEPYFISIEKDLSETIHQQQIIQRQIHSLEQAKQFLESLSRADSITDVYNKRYFKQQYPV